VLGGRRATLSVVVPRRGIGTAEPTRADRFSQVRQIANKPPVANTYNVTSCSEAAAMQDLRLAIRALRSTPVVTGVAILSLALGIGANTAIFSLVNSLLLRALPVVEPQRLVTVASPRAVELGGTGGWSYPVWEQVRERPQLFDSVVAWGTQRFNLAQGGETQFIDGLLTSGSYFRVLGVPALLGRTITDADDRRGGGPDGAVAVISYGFWQRRFGGAADAVGQTLVIEHVPFTIVGVTPQEFFGMAVGRTFDVAVPIGDEPLIRGRESRLDNRNFSWLTIVARLGPGQTIEAARTALQRVQPQIRDATLPNAPKAFLDQYLTGREGLTLVSTAADNSGMRGRYRRPLLTIMVVVALVLLIASANIANLLLARTTARRHELSVRLALGASRWRLLRQHLAESLVLAATGTAFGFLIASWGSRVLVRQLSTQNNTVFLDLALDWRVLMFTTGVMAITVVLSALAPAIRTSGIAPMDALKEHGRGTAGDARGSVANGLIVVQVALSVVLVVGAGLFVRTFATLATRDLGFERDRALLVNVAAQRAAVDPAQRRPLFERVSETVRGLPGVADAALSTITPVQGGGMIRRIEVSGGVAVPPTLLGGIANSMGNQISSRWFSTLGIPIIAGRDFTDRDRGDSSAVAIVNLALARRFLDGGSPLGHTITNIPLFGRPLEIVGVVGDSVYGSLREPAQPTVYTPLGQFDGPADMLSSVNLTVRSSGGSPALLTKSVAAAIVGLDPGLTLTFRPLADQVNSSLTQERIVAMLSGFFGALALLLAGLGLYGVTSYAVARRRPEIGIRVALGASPAGVVRLVLVRVAWLVGIGVLIGAVVSLWTSQFVATLLYGLQPRDPITLVGATVTLAIVGLLAGWLPAWRASRIDPAQVLRES
jgi:putative ABC transport system permease protein